MQTTVPPACSGFERIPLCGSYSAVHLEVCLARVAGHSSSAECPLRWAVGMVPDGQTEVLGVWPEMALQGCRQNLVAKDLLMRGVRRVGLLISGTSTDSGDALRRAFPHAADAPSFHAVAALAQSLAAHGDRRAISAGMVRLHRAESEQHAHAVLDGLATSSWQASPASVQICRAAVTSWHSLYTLSKRVRGRLRRGEDIAWLLQQGVSRAVTRHGPFQSAEDAAAFSEAWLEEAECRQRVERRLRGGARWVRRTAAAIR
jgi:transposase-like protein